MREDIRIKKYTALTKQVGKIYRSEFLSVKDSCAKVGITPSNYYSMCAELGKCSVGMSKEQKEQAKLTMNVKLAERENRKLKLADKKKKEYLQKKEIKTKVIDAKKKRKSRAKEQKGGGNVGNTPETEEISLENLSISTQNGSKTGISTEMLKKEKSNIKEVNKQNGYF